MSREEDLCACDCGWKGRGNGQGPSMVHGAVSWQEDEQGDVALVSCHTFVWKLYPMCGKETEGGGCLPALGPGILGHPGSSLTLRCPQPAFPTASLFGSISLRIWRTAAVALWPRGPGGVSHCGQGR